KGLEPVLQSTRRVTCSHRLARSDFASQSPRDDWFAEFSPSGRRPMRETDAIFGLVYPWMLSSSERLPAFQCLDCGRLYLSPVPARPLRQRADTLCGPREQPPRRIPGGRSPDLGRGARSPAGTSRAAECEAGRAEPLAGQAARGGDEPV